MRTQIDITKDHTAGVMFGLCRFDNVLHMLFIAATGYRTKHGGNAQSIGLSLNNIPVQTMGAGMFTMLVQHGEQRTGSSTLFHGQPECKAGILTAAP